MRVVLVLRRSYVDSAPVVSALLQKERSVGRCVGRFHFSSGFILFFAKNMQARAALCLPGLEFLAPSFFLTAVSRS